MAGYGEFASVYDLLTENVPYDEIAEYYNGIIKELGATGNLLLDMGCGTGNLTLRLADMGYDIIASDASAEMLTIASEKLSGRAQLICQSMTETELYGAVDIAVSTLDSINHLDSAADIFECFKRTAENMNSGGLFLFDVNTIYKHREILGNNTFVYDVDGVYCVWQNEYQGDGRTDIYLDFFAEDEESGMYDRYSDDFSETAYPAEKIKELLIGAGFEICACYEYLTENEPTEESEKLTFVARKK